MDFNNRPIQIIVIGIALLLLASVGVTTLRTADLQAQVEQLIGTQTANRVEDTSQLEDQTQATSIEVTPQPTSGTDPSDPTSPGDATQATATPTDRAADGSNSILKVDVPGDNNTVFLSSTQPEIQIQLSTSETVTATDVRARIFILNRVFDNNVKEPLGMEIASDEGELPAFDGTSTSLTLKFQTLPPSGNYEGWLIVTGNGIPSVSKRLTVEVVYLSTNVTDNPRLALETTYPNLSSLAFQLPTNDRLFVLTKDHPQVNFRVQNLTTTEVTGVDVQLLIVKRKDGSNETLLDRGFFSESTSQTFGPFEARNITLTLDPVPPSGEYTGWLVVSSENSKLATESVTLTIAADPEETIHYRLTGTSAEANKIVLSGVRTFPLRRFEPNPYNLMLWEANLRPLEECKIIASELADKTNGHVGSLKIDPVSPCNAGTGEPTNVTLTLENIEHAGSYEGILQITTPRNGKNQVIPVVAFVRDSLWWPAAVIFFSSLLLGWAIRYRLGKAAQNGAYLQHTIVRMRDQLQRQDLIQKNPALYNQIDGWLKTAELLIKINDLEEARKYINAADDKLGGTIIEEKGLGDRIEMQRPPNEFSPVSGRVLIYAGEEVLFKLVTDPEIDEKDKITWLIDDLHQKHGPQFHYKPQKRGIFRLKVMWKKKDSLEKPNLSLTLEIVADPVAVSARWVWITALSSAFVWAAIATVAGLVYISARIPTFGSEMDYLLAMAWAFGLSTVAQPTESIISNIMNRLAPDTKESESGNEEQSQNEEQNQRKTETTDKVTVPSVIKDKRDDTKRKLSEAGLIAKFEPDDAGADWTVGSMRPEANTKVEKNTTVYCTLMKPSSGGDGGNKIDGDPGDA